MAKMTDFEMWELGLMDQKDTWWGKKMAAYEAAVDAGKYGEVLKKELRRSGWLDGVKEPCFVLLRAERKAIVVKVSESGVFESMPGGGWGRIEEIDHGTY
jgi:hypothetical protein